MARSALRLLPADEARTPLSQCIESGRLVELSAEGEGVASARTTTAVSLLRHAQQQGETTAWIQPVGGCLFPPDLEHNGIDLEALVVVHVPPAPSSPHKRSGLRGHGPNVAPHRLCKAAEILLRSGAFGLVVVDFCEGAPPASTESWQGRLLGLARQHHSLVLLLTEKPAAADSLGSLVSLRIQPQRQRGDDGQFLVEHEILKNKSGAPLRTAVDLHRGPWGLR
jgi:recombination protein RecA